MGCHCGHARDSGGLKMEEMGVFPGRNSRTERIRHEAGEQALSERGVWMINGDWPPRPGVRVCGQGRVWCIYCDAGVCGVLGGGGGFQKPGAGLGEGQG